MAPFGVKPVTGSTEKTRRSEVKDDQYESPVAPQFQSMKGIARSFFAGK
jgi:hypothetical protein